MLIPIQKRLQQKISQQIQKESEMSYKNTRRLNKSISPPCIDRSTIPQFVTKYQYNQTTGQSNIHGHLYKQCENQGISAFYNGQRGGHRDDDVSCWTLAQVNAELQNNLSLIISLLSRRKMLSQAKRRRIKQQMDERMAKAKEVQIQNFEYMDDEQFNKIINFCPNTQVAIKILGKVIRLLPELKGPRADEEQKSQNFWIKNRQLQNQIDTMLDKMKSIDKNLQKQNVDVNQICKNLDQVEQNLKSMVGITKCENNIQKIEPLFKMKKKNYEILNSRIKQRERIKDIKVSYIKKIKDTLHNLKVIRQNRLYEITKFFGLQNVWDIQKYNFKDAGDFSLGFQELLKIRQKSGFLDIQCSNTLEELDAVIIDSENICNQLIRKQSDEVKAYCSYTKIMNQRIKYTQILSIFGNEQTHNELLFINAGEMSKKFKEYKNFLKRFMQQDSLIKQGLIKTNQTSHTFNTILQAIQNQKQRRQQLLVMLENCIRKRGDYQHKKEQVRNIMVLITKNQQEHAHHQEQLETILSDGDIESYKRIGNSISRCESEKQRLWTLKQKLEKDMQVMDKEVVGMANRIQKDYQDILCEVVPADYEYSLKNSDDVKKLQNHLRKMYKRLGILSSQ